MSNKLLLSITAGLLCWCLPSMGQSTFGAILGNVKDATGAVVRGAKVRIAQTAENASREAETNTEGGYEFQNIEAGPYTVTVTAPGFRTFAAQGLILVARARLRVDATLEVGELSQNATTLSGVTRR